jgi:four helix bundle protein
MNENILSKKSLAFAIRIVKFVQHIQLKKEYVLSNQILRSGTSIGAHVREANFAQSKADFIHKLSGAQKEANETEYWLILLKEGNYITNEEFISMDNDAIELLRILTSSITTAKSKIKK